MDQEKKNMSAEKENSSEKIKKLKYCIGKAVYLRNTDIMMHFMPMKEFFVENSLTFCHLFFLRTLRLNQGNASGSGLDNTELNRWMDGTSVKIIAETAQSILNFKFTLKPKFNILEFYGHIGLTAEYLKLLISQNQFSDTSINYFGFNPESVKKRFEFLQNDEKHKSFFIPENNSEKKDLKDYFKNKDLIIYNQDEIIKRGYKQVIPIEEILNFSDKPMMLVLRITNYLEHRNRTTIKGDNYNLLTKDEIFEKLSIAGGNWKYICNEGFDEDFFLPLHKDPENKEESKINHTSLLIAFNCYEGDDIDLLEDIIHK